MENASQTTPEQPVATPQADLTVSDLQNIKSLIETSVRRGTFQAHELSAVGNVFDRLNNFLTAVAATPKADN